MKNDIHTSVRLPAATVDALREIGERDDRSIAYVIRRALDEYVAANTAPKKKTVRKKKAAA